MIELRFHRDVYAGEAVDAAVNALARFGRLERAEAPGYWIVRVSARTPDKERRLAGELGNRALGDSAARRPAAGSAGVR